MPIPRVKEIEGRLDIALSNNMPIESKYMFVGELAARLGEDISREDYARMLKKLGFTSEELFKFTDFVMFGKLAEED